MKYTIVTGDLVSGFKLIGLFFEEDYAVKAAEYLFKNEDWSVIPIQTTLPIKEG